MSDLYYSSPRWKKKTSLSVGAIALGLSALLLPGCDNTNRTDQISQGETNVTADQVSQVAEDNQLAAGEMITVRSPVTQPVGNSGFVMNPEDGESILVINASGAPFTVPAGEMPVQATGQVETLVIADLNRRYNLALEPNLYVNYENKPAIIAQSLALAPTPEDLYQAPQGYFDKPIAIQGEVRKFPNTTNGFAVFEQGWVDDIGIMVIGGNPNVQNSAIQEGESVVVTGVARQPNAQLLEQANLGWDANKINEFLTRYTNRPVIVAEEVYPSAVER